MHCSSLGQTAAEVSCLPSPVPEGFSEVVATNPMHSITWHLLDGHEAPQKSHWGVTKILSKIQLGTRALFVRPGEVETPFPRRFLQFHGAEAEAWSPEPSNNNVLSKWGGIPPPAQTAFAMTSKQRMLKCNFEKNFRHSDVLEEKCIRYHH